MKVIKRNGAEVEFDIVKIIAAVSKAFVKSGSHAFTSFLMNS